MGVEFMSSKNSFPRFLHIRFFFALFAALAVLVFLPASRAQESVVQFDLAQTKIEFTLGASLHTVHGDFKLKSGMIRFNPSTGAISGTIIVDATSGDSGNGGRDRRMHREILESDKFPEILFTPRQVTGALAAEGPSKVEVSGQFRLHGQDHDVTFPIDVLSGGQQLQLATRLVIPYVQWGLRNPSTFILRVSDKVTIDIHAVGHVTNAAASH